jgi:hypothetical protein
VQTVISIFKYQVVKKLLKFACIYARAATSQNQIDPEARQMAISISNTKPLGSAGTFSTSNGNTYNYRVVSHHRQGSTGRVGNFKACELELVKSDTKNPESSGNGSGGESLSGTFWINFVQMCQRLQTDPYDMASVLYSESGLNPHARNIQGGKVIAQGFNQIIGKTAKELGMSKDLWNNFNKLSPEESLRWTEKYFRKSGKTLKGKSATDLWIMNFGGFNNPDGSLYASIAAQRAWMARHPGDTFQNPLYQQKAIEQNRGLVENGRIMPDRAKRIVSNNLPNNIKILIGEAIKNVGNLSPPPFQEPNPNWSTPEVAPQSQDSSLLITQNQESTEVPDAQTQPQEESIDQTIQFLWS